MALRIALAGNPNCGKTTLFNILTGANQYVGNWPGVTVEKKEGKLKGEKDVVITDLPGIYSLSPYTLEEVVARNYLLYEKPDAILNIVDASNLERNLYLTTQLTELGIPVVIALNMMDIVRKNGDRIDTGALSKSLGCRVVEISALKGEGVAEVSKSAVEAASSKKAVKKPAFSDTVEAVITEIEQTSLSGIQEERRRWYAVKLFEKDSRVREQLSLSSEIQSRIDTAVESVEKELDDDAESIITNERYEYITKILKGIYRKNRSGKMSVSDRIDSVVTNRFLAIPIFLAVIWLVYFLAMQTVGTFATDWTNDVLFGEIVPGIFDSILGALGVPEGGVLYGLIQDGIVAGVGAVIGFVPQMLVLFLLLAILEQCGYMARIAFILDRIFRKFGLSGKSFIPMLVGTGCGVPGVMASRTIENERDRRMTIMTTTFIPCGAKLPIIALIAGAVFGGSSWVGFSAYVLGIAAVIVSGIILKKTKMFAGDPAPFVMELPAYHMPRVIDVLKSMWERGWSFIKKAGTIILLSTIAVWFGTYFGVVPGEGFRMLDETEIDYSILASIGSAIAWIFIPLGWGEWRGAVAAVTGLVAKENVVGTFGILFKYYEELSEEGEEIWPAVQAFFGTGAAAYSFLAFNLLCAPCFAAIGAIKREMNNAKWTWFAIGYQCLLAYLVSLVIYQIGSIFAGQPSIPGIIAAVVIIAVGVWLLVRPYKEATTFKSSVKLTS